VSYQVGKYCYATVPDAGLAACAQYLPVSQLVPGGGAVKTVSCAGADAATGALQLFVTTSPTDLTASTVEGPIPHGLAYMPCQDESYVNAGLAIFAAFLAVAASAFGLWMIFQWINRGARNQE
jgi:hypothetical protein